MDCLKTRCTTVFYDYRANLIDYEEFKRRLKAIDDEIKTKQTSLPLKEKEVESETEQLTSFSLLALGTRFKYKEGETVWVKIGADLVARWDAKERSTGWTAQSVCSATEDGEEIEVIIVD